MKVINQSPERIYLSNPDNKELTESELKHVSRYKFADMLIPSGLNILDCACGSGYGTKILSKRANYVHGIDIDEEVIEFAKKNNDATNIHYGVRDIGELDSPLLPYDVFISFETLEHIPHETFISFMNLIYSSMQLSSTAIFSSPMLRYDNNGEPYVTNPYHINELPRAKLIQTIKRIFVGCTMNFHRQYIDAFPYLQNENDGFLIMVITKKIARGRRISND